MLCHDMEPNNKIHTRNQRKGNNNVLMSKNGHPTTKADVNSEVSLSFQDELAATIHGAFEVAVEIAVLEITKLVGQALGDVRDQMHETLRENKALQLRLQATELELDAVRTSVENQTLIPPVTVGQPGTTSRIQQDRRSPSPHLNSQAKTGKLKNIRDGESHPKALNVTGSSLNVALQETYGVLVAPTETNAPDNGSFSEIREDGRVCSQDLKPHLGADPVANEGMGVISASKINCPGYTENQALLANCDQKCSETALGGNTTSSLYVDPRGSEVMEVKVKEEKSELDRSSGSAAGAGTACASHAVGEDDFGSDSLSLAQSKLLEDWRPEPLHLQRCDSDSFVPCTSHSLSDPPVFSPDTTDPNGLSPSASALHPFPSPYTNHYQPEVAGVSALQQAYGVQINSASPATGVNPRAHVCKVCNEAFHLPGELRRHHSQCHGNKALSRNPKRQTFPPGRSPYHCSQCGRDFNRMENLKTHLRIHTGERPYSCSVCGVRFRHSGALTRHFRIHTGEKPYVCSQCGKTFRNCGGLRFHQRSHMRQGQSMAD